MNEGAITLERIMLQDGAQVDSEEAVMHARRRWTSSSPLYRAAMAMLAYWESQGIDPGHCHLHGTRGLVLASAALIGYRDQLISTGQGEFAAGLARRIRRARIPPDRQAPNDTTLG